MEEAPSSQSSDDEDSLWEEVRGSTMSDDEQSSEDDETEDKEKPEGKEREGKEPESKELQKATEESVRNSNLYKHQGGWGSRPCILHSFESLLQKSNTVEAGHCDPRI
jgi:hypothetical protein